MGRSISMPMRKLAIGSFLLLFDDFVGHLNHLVHALDSHGHHVGRDGPCVHKVGELRVHIVEPISL